MLYGLVLQVGGLYLGGSVNGIVPGDETAPLLPGGNSGICKI